MNQSPVKLTQGESFAAVNVGSTICSKVALISAMSSQALAAIDAVSTISCETGVYQNLVKAGQMKPRHLRAFNLVSTISCETSVNQSRVKSSHLLL